jgi:DNA mismatch repair protein MutL
MDPALVDVNVHPAKREVRFHRESELRQLVTEAVGDALRTPAPRPVVIGSVAAPDREKAEHRGAAVIPELDSQVAPQGEPAVESPSPAETWTVESQPELPQEEPTEVSVAPSFRVVGAVCGEYVVLEAHDGMVLLDPAAARERILYERFLAGASAGAAESQGLLVPVLLELDARDADTVLRNVDNFAEAGMEVASFGGRTIQLRALPALLAGADPKALLLDLVDDIVDGVGRTTKRLTFERFAERLAAVGARGEKCRGDAARVLLEELFACDLPYCTPGGRPTLVQISLSELARKFGKSPSGS